jgi:hypothetical protein
MQKEGDANADEVSTAGGARDWCNGGRDGGGAGGGGNGGREATFDTFSATVFLSFGSKIPDCFNKRERERERERESEC